MVRPRSHASAKLALWMTAAAACSEQSAPASAPAPGISSMSVAGSAALPSPTVPSAGSGAPRSPRPMSDGGSITSPPSMNGSAAGASGQGPDEPPAGPDAVAPDAATPESETPRLKRCADATGTPSADPGTGYPGGRWTVSEAMYGTVVESNVQIAMSDGVVLVGDVSYPAELGSNRRATGEFPVILTQNPYGAGFGADSGSLFVTHGYIFASIDVRGTSRSDGTHDMFSPREAEDGAALVAWAATLEGSDGRVGLQGCSQLGINQLETATQLGPDSPVKAMIPACASGDFYRDTAFDNGIPTIVGNLLAVMASSPDARPLPIDW